MNDNSTAGPHPYTRTLLEELDRQRRLRDRWRRRYLRQRRSAELWKQRARDGYFALALQREHQRYLRQKQRAERWKKRAGVAEWTLRQRRS